MAKADEPPPSRDDPGSFEEAVSAFRGRVHRAAYLLCGDLEAADELTQETFVQAWLGWSRFAGRSSVFTWLYGILLNVRRTEARKRAPRVDPHGSNARIPSPVERVECREEQGLVRRAIGVLSEELRETLVLFYVQDLPHAEVARTLGIPVGTVKSRLSAARREVGQELLRLGWRPE